MLFMASLPFVEGEGGLLGGRTFAPFAKPLRDLAAMRGA
jgi:hypothetical protein